MSDNLTGETAKPTNPLISLPNNTRQFQASGHTYFVEDALSIERYKAFQRMEIELGYTLSFSDLANKIKKAYDLHNDSKFADAAVLLWNIMEGAAAISEKKPISLYVATLFINRSDEDRTVWSKTLAEEKLKDWSNIEVNFFLIVALSKVRGFSQSLQEISEMMETVGSLKNQMTENLSDLDND